MNLVDLATLFRALNLYSHHAHNMAKGNSFMQDHAFFAEVYAFADDCYDSLIERYLGTGGENVKLPEIVQDSHELISKMPSEYYQGVLFVLDRITKHIDNMCNNGKFSSGTQNLLQGQADSIEVFIYKIKRRLK